MKKTVYTLCVDGYAPEITAITFPLMRRYAGKIGAGFYVINERKFPGFPPVYEKLQIYELGKEHGNDWNIYFDADALVHPDMMDVTEHLSKDTVMHNGRDVASNRWAYDGYFRRDGRHIGSCNWLAVASDWCLDLWHPLDIPMEEAIANIHPIVMEEIDGITPGHLIDDYTLSRNIARYGLKFTTFPEIWKKFGQEFGYLFHTYRQSEQQKIEQMKKVLVDWRLNPTS